MAGKGNPNPSPENRFKKGDPRIWRGGRPKSFPALQELAQEIAHEKAKAGGNTVVIDGHSVTVAEAILRQWAQSKNPALQQKFIEVAFGKVPQPVDLRGEVKHEHKHDFSRLNDSELEQLGNLVAKLAGDTE